MSPEGYILTNNHVTSGADQIVVALKDGRETLARVIGSDPETDLAVLKIDLKNLPAITSAAPTTSVSATSRWPSATRSASARP
jgi:S1-C subfamily serine protease